MTVEIIEPKVTLIASTDVDYDYDDMFAGLTMHGMELDPKATPPDDLGEFAGRACYQAFHKPNPATRENKDYIANIIRQGHGSVLEHASATFYLEGVSRALTHELIRHRHLSYSQLSQRFVDEGRRAIVIPPAMRGTQLEADLAADANIIFNSYESYVQDLQGAGKTRKQAREAARAVLPNCTETKIVVTGNMRAWRDVIAKRHDEAADAEIFEISGMILDKLRVVAPASFQDFE